MRCPDDIEFANLCDRVGEGPSHITWEDINFFNSRTMTGGIAAEDINDNFTTGKIAILVTTNNKKDGINLRKVRTLLPDEEEYTCLSTDSITDANAKTCNPELLQGYEKKGKKGVVKNLIIRNKAPVVITENHKIGRYKEDGISNGSRGYIDYIQTDQDGQVDIIWVVFKDEKIGSKCYKRETRKHRPKEDMSY